MGAGSERVGVGWEMVEVEVKQELWKRENC